MNCSWTGFKWQDFWYICCKDSLLVPQEWAMQWFFFLLGNREAFGSKTAGKKILLETFMFDKIHWFSSGEKMFGLIHLYYKIAAWDLKAECLFSCISDVLMQYSLLSNQALDESLELHCCRCLHAKKQTQSIKQKISGWQDF